jgi:hypothetical protein
MRKLLIPVILWLIFLSHAYGQSDFRYGFIITLGSDTVKGQLDFRSNAKNYVSCLFRDNQGAREYYPNQIKAFGYENDKFFSAGVVDNAFVEVLVAGDISLYKYKEHFLIRKGDQLHTLIPKKEVTDDNGQSSKVNDNRWRGLIIWMINDCLQNPSKYTDRLDIREQNLTELVTRYNRCRGNQFIENKVSKPWTKFESGIAAGATLTRLRVNDKSGYFPYLSQSYLSPDAEIGGLVAISSPRISERIAFQSEIYFRKSAFSGYVEKRGTSNDYFDTYVNLTTLSLPLSVKYTFPGKRSHWYVRGGIAFDHHLQNRSKLLSEMEANGVVFTFPEEVAFEVRKNAFGFQGGFGWLKNFPGFRSGITLSYFRLSQLNKTPGFAAVPQRVSLHLILMTK